MTEPDASPHGGAGTPSPGAAPANLSKRAIVALLLVGAVLGAGIHRVLINSLTGRGASAPSVHQQTPHLVREGQRIRIPDSSPLRNKLVVEPVRELAIERSLALPAVVEPDPARLVKVLPPLAGRVIQLKVQMGERVEAGQPLLTIDSSDLGTAYADYDRGKVLLDLARKNRDRVRDLAKIGGAAVRDQQQAETDYVTAEVELQRAEARLRQIGVEAEPAEKSRMITVSAPISGSIIDLAVAPGAFWNDANASLMTIADLNTIWVTANVPEKDTSKVTKGQSVEVVFAAYPGTSLRGSVLFVSDVLDSDTRRTKVRIAFPNPDIRLKPGMFASVNFLTPAETYPVVPVSAIILKDDTDRVFVEVEPWIFEARSIEVGFQQGDQAVIKSGVETGARVVVKGAVLLND